MDMPAGSRSVGMVADQMALTRVRDFAGIHYRAGRRTPKPRSVDAATIRQGERRYAFMQVSVAARLGMWERKPRRLR